VSPILACAGLIMASVDINDVKIDELANKPSISFLFINILEKVTKIIDR
jgi:hypothetical protein